MTPSKVLIEFRLIPVLSMDPEGNTIVQVAKDEEEDDIRTIPWLVEASMVITPLAKAAPLAPMLTSERSSVESECAVLQDAPESDESSTWPEEETAIANSSKNWTSAIAKAELKTDDQVTPELVD